MDKRKARILVVDDEPGHVVMLKALLGKWQYLVTGAASGEEAVDLVREKSFDLVLMDVCMGGMDGITALKAIKSHNPAIPVLIMTAYSTVPSAVDALKSGAYDYLLKPLDFDSLRETLDGALEHILSDGSGSPKEGETQSTPRASTNILGNSEAMRTMKELIRTVAPTEATVLITGKSGTGKELVARAIHTLSKRADAPLVTVNCAALSENLLESELFGHEKGAFTGADRKREGRFFHANTGTIFLDEIGEISLPLQAKLLRVIQQREIQRVGSDKTFIVDVRIIGATNRDLREEVAAGRFREDLYYRLNVLHVRVPSLVERVEDIPLLAQHFLRVMAKKHNKDIKGFTPAALDRFLRYPWPGNVRELENAVEQTVILLNSQYVDESNLPPILRETPVLPEGGLPEDNRAMLDGKLEDVEREAILHTLRLVNDSKTEAAERLGISRKTLYAKLKRYGMQ